jgi:hypothetical protein
VPHRLHGVQIEIDKVIAVFSRRREHANDTKSTDQNGRG